MRTDKLLLWRGKGGQRLTRHIAAVLLGLACVLSLLWILSYWTNFGVGAGKGTAPNGHFIEVTTVTDGLLIVRNGTRMDNICYDTLTGSGYGPSEYLYLVIFDTVGGPHVWWPRVEHPATWCGPYMFVPLWMPILVCLTLGIAPVLVLMRRPPPGSCTKCWYPRAGLPPNAPCPECGAEHVQV